MKEKSFLLNFADSTGKIRIYDDSGKNIRNSGIFIVLYSDNLPKKFNLPINTCFPLQQNDNTAFIIDLNSAGITTFKYLKIILKNIPDDYFDSIKCDFDQT
ncbi:MAG: hypothetical protein KAY16_05300 [Spirochaetes bacterium]|nr:hypothetical protein [Spirochaetota bacterium]